jgi:hypothetical protein
MTRTSRRAAAIAVAIGALTFFGAGPAPAAPAPPDGTREGLMRATLAANPDSVRVSRNQIQLEPGLLMTLPGERDSATTEQARRSCNYLYFCLYEHAYWKGASLAMSACKIYKLSSYVFWNATEKYWDDWVADASSWTNNQSGGAVATMWHPAGYTMRVRTADHHFPPGWNDRVYRVKPC